MASPEWFPYVARPGGIFMPQLQARLSVRESGSSGPRSFLIDTAAGVSIAPESYLLDLVDFSEIPREWTGCFDVHNKKIWGKPMVVAVSIGKLPPIEETIYFTAGDTPFGLLGQRVFLQRARAYFFNSITPDRKFGLLAR